MLARLLLIAGLLGIAGATGLEARETPERAPAPKETPKKEEPTKGPKKEEPKKEEPKKEEPKKGPKDEPKKEPKEEPKKEPKKEPEKGPKDEPKKAPATGTPPATPPVTPKAITPPKPGALKKYDDVITKEAKTTAGVFAVHRIDDKVLFEIPADKLGKLMMFRAEVSKGPSGVSFNGQALGTKFIKFDRKDNKIFVTQAGFDKRGDKSTEAAIEAAHIEPIIATFPVECEGKDRSVVITVTQVFMNDSMDIGAKRAGGFGGQIDPEKSYLLEVKAFPLNIEVRALLTSRGGGGGGSPFGPPGGAGGSPVSNTAIVHYSLFSMPDEPMKPRFFDSRVGYFTEEYSEFAGSKTWVQSKQLIARYRLEKKDPSAAVSEPVKPIVYYLAPEIPERWREYMKKGVEDWKPAFEAAGFKNAIICKDPPTKAEDPNWDAEDARYSVIRWVAEPVANAMGPHVHDPRSGEIISAHIIFWHDILKIVHMWYFVQCSAIDPRARKFPFPDELTGELIRYVTAHEVGHTLGLRHNHRASTAYSIEQLRDPKFLEKNGNVASIMSYGRYNYVAQPEDKIPVKDLVPKLAPYDIFAIEWGYKGIPTTGSDTEKSEKATLDEWASRQVKEPFLRFGGEDAASSVDPTVLTENIGNDPVKATELGLKNMDRVMGYLLDSTTEKGEDFEILGEAYAALMSHRRNWLMAVLKQVGGVVENRSLGGRGEQFSRISKEKQQLAVKFLIDNAFNTPKKMLDPAIVNSFKFAGVAADTMGLQRQILAGLLSSSRLGRLMDAEVLNPDSSYTVGELLGEVQAGIWSELKGDAPKIDPLRRGLQRTYIENLKGEFAEGSPSGGSVTLPGRRGGGGIDFGPSKSPELRAYARISLKDLAKQIEAALPKVKDPITKAHLQDSLEEIEAVIESTKKK